MPKHQEKVASSHKHVAFLVFFAAWYAEFTGNLLKLRWSFGIIGLEACRSGSVK